MTLEQLRERDALMDATLRQVVAEFLKVTGYDLKAIACAGRMYAVALRAAMRTGAFITEPVYQRISNALVYLASLEVR